MGRLFDLKNQKLICLKMKFSISGSTWAQELIWLLGNNLNYAGARVVQQVRAPLLELSTIFSDDHNGWLK
jgi:hypothetical protein